MQSISLNFLLFTMLVVIMYCVLPAKYRWIVLLVSSIYFYYLNGLQPLLLLLFITLISYLLGLIINKISDNKKRITYLLSICFLSLTLVFFKTYNYFDIKGIVFPVGISYYTFSLISYLSDVYWKKTNVESNYFKFLLYVSYFPKIIEGPIVKYKTIGLSLTKENELSQSNISLGIQRIFLGFFKIYVIQTRIDELVEQINLLNVDNNGLLILMIISLSSFVTYCNFSGCMDIAIGVSKLFSIDLDENFDRPFSSTTVSEFWRRWHITLHDWFNDYVYMPIFVSSFNRKIGIFVKNKANKKIAKTCQKFIPIMVVWIFTGLWHGVTVSYLIWCVYWMILIILPMIFGDLINKTNSYLKINDKSPLIVCFRRIRTFLLFAISGVFISHDKLSDSISTLSNVAFNFKAIESLKILKEINIRQCFAVIILIILLLFFESKVGDKMLKKMKLENRSILIRGLVYTMMIIIVVMFGIYTSDGNSIEMNYKYF